MGEMYGSCGMCGDRLPPPSSAGHQCIVGRVRFNPTGAGVTATVPQFTINPLPTFNALPSPQSQIESLQRLLAEKDAQIAAMSKDMVKIAGMVDSANERIEALTAENAELRTALARWKFVGDERGGHMLNVSTGDKWYPESCFLA